MSHPAGIDPSRIGSSYFTVIDGRLCGLHIKNANVFVVSLTQEPLQVALGSFRISHLAECTNSAAAHLPSILDAFIGAFDTDSSHSQNVHLIYPLAASGTTELDQQLAEAEEESHFQQTHNSSTTASKSSHANAQRQSNLLAKHRKSAMLQHQLQIHGSSGSPRKPPLAGREGAASARSGGRNKGGDNSSSSNAMSPEDIPTVRVNFTLFGIEHVLSLQLHPCPDLAKDPFVWSLVMDLFRAMLRVKAQGAQQRQQLVSSQRGGISSSSSSNRVGVGGGASPARPTTAPLAFNKRSTNAAAAPPPPPPIASTTITVERTPVQEEEGAVVTTTTLEGGNKKDEQQQQPPPSSTAVVVAPPEEGSASHPPPPPAHPSQPQPVARPSGSAHHHNRGGSTSSSTHHHVPPKTYTATGGTLDYERLYTQQLFEQQQKQSQEQHWRPVNTSSPRASTMFRYVGGGGGANKDSGGGGGSNSGGLGSPRYTFKESVHHPSVGISTATTYTTDGAAAATTRAHRPQSAGTSWASGLKSNKLDLQKQVLGLKQRLSLYEEEQQHHRSVTAVMMMEGQGNDHADGTRQIEARPPAVPPQNEKKPYAVVVEGPPPVPSGAMVVGPPGSKPKKDSQQPPAAFSLKRLPKVNFSGDMLL